MNCCKLKVLGSISIVNSPVLGNISDVLSITGNISLDLNIINQELSLTKIISALLTPVKNIEGFLSPMSIISGEVSTEIIKYDLPNYLGVYEVTPVPYLELELLTAHTIVNKNIIVNEIPYYETTNISGGYTVIIG